MKVEFEIPPEPVDEPDDEDDCEDDGEICALARDAGDADGDGTRA